MYLTFHFFGGFVFNIEFDFSALVLPTGGTETTNSLWGENKEDPKDALDTNGFQMRRMVLHVSQSGRRRGKGRQRRYANKNNGNQTAE